MDAARALADLTEISSQIEAVVLTGGDGAVLGSTVGDEERAGRIAAGAARLLEEGGRVAAGPVGAEPVQVEASTPEGSVFVVRQAGRTIAATTTPEPTVGLVFYDLKSCLRSLDADEPATPKRRRPRKQAEGDGPA